MTLEEAELQRQEAELTEHQAPLSDAPGVGRTAEVNVSGLLDMEVSAGGAVCLCVVYLYLMVWGVSY